MLSAIFGIFAVLSAVAGYWVAAIICGVLMLISMEVSSDERAHYRARVNRDRYWAYGEEPDWKRRQREERHGAEWSRNSRAQRAREAKWLKEQERIATEKRRKYMEQMRANRR